MPSGVRSGGSRIAAEEVELLEQLVGESADHARHEAARA